MKKTSSGNIKSYMLVLIGVFVAAAVLTNVTAIQVMDRISIESPLYQEIQNSNDLKADMLPPKLYIVEAYLIIQQLATETDAEQAAILLTKIAAARADYDTCYSAWQSKTNDENILRLLLTSNESVNEFFRIFDDQFMPAFNSQDYQAMQKTAALQLMPLFSQHRQIIVDMADYLQESNVAIESHAAAFADQVKIILFIACGISLVIIILISIIILKKVTTVEKHILASRHETELANERLETMVEGLKRFKHSYDNTLAAINGYVIEDNNAGLKAYLDEVIVEKNKNETVNYFKLGFLQNPALIGLIIAKMMQAEKLGVELSLKVRSEVANIGIKPSHLCEVLGILLDNAIEAAGESEIKQVYFKIEESANDFVFKIKNSLKDSPDPSKMFAKGWTTKEQSHGFGLWLAQDIINKYDNVLLNTTVEDDYVAQELIIIKKDFDAEKTMFTDIL